MLYLINCNGVHTVLLNRTTAIIQPYLNLRPPPKKNSSIHASAPFEISRILVDLKIQTRFTGRDYSGRTPAVYYESMLYLYPGQCIRASKKHL
jgi:hypothetical protein